MRHSSYKQFLFSLITLFILIGKPAAAQQPDSFRSKDDLASWIYHQLQYAAAEPLSRADILTQTQAKAWRQPKTPEEIQAWLDLLTNQGYTWLLDGNIVRSTDSYTSAFEWAKQHADEVDPTQVLDNILKPLGNNYTRLGDFEQALYIHNKALALAKTLDDPDALAGTYSNLANTASNMGYTDRSLEYCRLGLAIPKVTPALRGLLLSEQADAYLQIGDQTAAMTSIQNSIPLLEKGNKTWLFLAYQQAGDIFASNPSLALKYYNKALILEQSQTSTNTGTREKAKLYQRLCRLYTNIKDTTNANHWFAACLTTLLPNQTTQTLQPSALIAENTLADLLFTGAELAKAQQNTDEAIRRYKLSFATDATLRSEYISGSAKQQSVAAVHDRYEAAIETAYDAWQTAKHKAFSQTILDFIEGSRAQLLMEELTRARQSRSAHDSIGNRIRLLQQAIIYYRKEALQHPVPQLKETEWQLAQLQKKHAPNTTTTTLLPKIPYTTRSWFAGRAALYTVEANNGQISFVERQPIPASLHQFTDHWFVKGASAMLNDPEAYYNEAFKIYQQLIAPHPLTPNHPYIFLPDGPLVGLPFDALPTKQQHSPSPSSWPFLIKEASISYAYSLQTLAESLHDKSNNKGFAGFFLPNSTRDLPQLNAMHQEQQGIQKLIPKGEWFENEKATTTAFAGSLQQSSVVHISTHAFSGKDTTTIPRIELYNAPYYIFELKDLGQHPDLVVLDACRTGDGRMVAGEGAQSLARAFTAGGVNAVIAGWWNVNDQTASALMQQFYGQLTDNPAATALHTAKLKWLENEKTSYQQKLPYYWAALNYTGDPSPKIDRTSPVNWLQLAVIILAAIILLGLLMAARRIILQPSR